MRKDSEKKEIWVFCEHNSNHEILPVTYEIISAARELAEKSNSLVAVVAVGNSTETVLHAVNFSPVDKLYTVSDAECMLWNSAVVTDQLEQLIKLYKPDIFLFPDTIYGKSIAARTAIRINTGLTANCTSFDIDPDTGSLLQTRPAFSGNVLATIICRKKRPQMATIKKGVFPECGRTDSAGNITIVKTNLSMLKAVRSGEIRLIETIPIKESTALKENEIMVGIGAGVGNSENMETVMEFTSFLKAGICATRTAVNNNWLDYSYQVGLSGKVIRPKVYIAIGISGSVQHMAGIASKPIIIGINKNKNAPIFNFCTHKIVGDVKEILPALITSLRIGVY